MIEIGHLRDVEYFLHGLRHIDADAGKRHRLVTLAIACVIVQVRQTDGRRRLVDERDGIVQYGLVGVQAAQRNRLLAEVRLEQGEVGFVDASQLVGLIGAAANDLPQGVLEAQIESGQRVHGHHIGLDGGGLDDLLLLRTDRRQNCASGQDKADEQGQSHD